MIKSRKKQTKMITNNVGDILNDMRDYAVSNNVPVISREGAALLANLVKTHQPGNILEIGTAIGYSSLLLAALQPPGSKLVTIEKNPARIQIAKQFFQTAPTQSQIEIIKGDAGDIVPFLEGYFDLVFIDAAKGQYLDYLHKVMDKLSEQAVIVADNVLFRGWVEPGLSGDDAFPRRFRTIVRRLREYLGFVRTDARFRTKIFPCGDGLAVSYYKRGGWAW